MTFFDTIFAILILVTVQLLYSRIGHQKCYKCNGKINNQSAEQIVDSILIMINQKIIISSPIIKNKKGEFKELLKSILHQGFTKIRLDNSILNFYLNSFRFKVFATLLFFILIIIYI